MAGYLCSTRDFVRHFSKVMLNANICPFKTDRNAPLDDDKAQRPSVAACPANQPAHVITRRKHFP